MKYHSSEMRTITHLMDFARVLCVVVFFVLAPTSMAASDFFYRWNGNDYRTLADAEEAMKAHDLINHPERADLSLTHEGPLGLEGEVIYTYGIESHYISGLELSAFGYDGQDDTGAPYVCPPTNTAFSCGSAGEVVALMQEAWQAPVGHCDVSVNTGTTRFHAVQPWQDGFIHINRIDVTIKYTLDSDINDGTCAGIKVVRKPDLPAKPSPLIWEGKPGNCDAGYNYKPFDVENEDPSAEHVECYSDTTDVIYKVPVVLACPHEGNPCNPLTGNKYLPVTDYEHPVLPLTRAFNSRRDGSDYASLGVKWTHNYSARMAYPDQQSQVVHIINQNGHRQVFSKLTNGIYKSWYGSGDVIEDLNGEWTLKYESGKWLTFDSISGRLKRIEYPDDSARDLFLSYDLNDRLEQVASRQGRTLQFAYVGAALDRVTLPDGGQVLYGYTDGNLTGVTYPDSNSVTYHYEDVVNPALVTGITDERNLRYATYAYDAFGRAILSEHAGGAGKIQLNYLPDGSTDVTMPLGDVRAYTPTDHAIRRVAQIQDGEGSVQNTYGTSNDRLQSKVDRRGVTTNMSYESHPGFRLTQRVEAVGMPEQRTVAISWDNDANRISQRSVGGQTDTTAYDTNGRLVSRTISGTAGTRTWTRSYLATTGSDPLSGLVQSVDGPRTDVADITTFEYYTTDSPSGLYRVGDLKRVVNGLGQATTYVSYGAAGRPLQIQDANDVTTTLAYNPRGWLTSSTIDGQTTSYSYTPTGQLLRVTQPNGAYLEYEYDQARRLVAVTDNLNHRIQYTLDVAGNRIAEETTDAGAVLKQKLARAYDTVSRLSTLTDGMLNASQFGYDGNGNQISLQDPNTETTNFSYDALNRLVETLQPSVTTLEQAVATYHFEDDLVDVTGQGNDATGSNFEYVNGPVGRAVKINTGGSLDFGAMDDFEGLDEFSVAAWLRVDQLSSWQFAFGKGTYWSAGDFALHCYNGDCGFYLDSGVARSDIATTAGQWYHWVAVYQNGVLTTYRDGVQTSSTSHAYTTGANTLHWTFGVSGNGAYPLGTAYLDELRIFKRALSGADVTQLHSGQDPSLPSLRPTTNYTYDDRDNLSSVTDPRGLVTTYTYDELDNLTQLDSPDTGITTYGYDSAGNRTSMTDARGVIVNYEYDALNRLTKIDYADNTLDIIYTYDQGTNGVGRLAGISDHSGSTTYSYDARGNMLSETRTIDGHSFTTSYGYDGANRLVSMTYPSGQIVTYGRDTLGRASQVSRNTGGGSVNLASGLSYLPFGPLTDLTLGNGIVVDRDYDLAYRITAINQGSVLARSYSYDPASNITAIADGLNAALSQTFGYDALSRLTTASGGYGNHSFIYDVVGNRAQADFNGSVVDYGYAADSNRLTAVGAQVLSMDAAGNTTDDGSHQFSFDTRNRMVSANSGATVLADYDYNGRGERVRKQTATTDTLFVFDRSGLLIAEADGAGAIQREYIYLNGERLAITEGTSVYYFHTDHLGTPQAVTDQTTAVVWQGDYQPFGEVAESGTLDQSFRFPGQFADDETGLYYNYFRDYDPSLGRYVESDPIGLEGGANTYSYVFENPVKIADPLGLLPPNDNDDSRHRTNRRESNRGKHEAGDARYNRDKSGERGDKKRRMHRKRPKRQRGPWPPKKRGFGSFDLSIRILCNEGFYNCRFCERSTGEPYCEDRCRNPYYRAMKSEECGVCEV